MGRYLSINNPNIKQRSGQRWHKDSSADHMNPAHAPESSLGNHMVQQLMQISGDGAGPVGSSFNPPGQKAEPSHRPAPTAETTGTATIQRSWWEDLTGGIANVASVGSLATQAITSAAAPGLAASSRIAGALAPAASAGMGTANKILGPASSALGVGMGAYNFATATNRLDQVQAGADTLASGAGFLGPVGTAFSGGYAGGQLLDQAVGGLTGASLSDRGGDALFDALGPGPGLWLADTFGL